MAAVAGDGRPFVGRTEAVDALYRRFEDARAGVGGVTLLVGPTGVGKSTLLDELVRNIRARGTQVLVGRAPALDAPPPFSLIRSALESARSELASEEGFVPGVPGAAPFLIGFAPRLDDAARSSPVRIEERLLSALGEVDERGESMREPIWTAVAEQFFAFTQRGPTVLVLEDLHRADEPSLEAIEYLARQLENRALWIIATARPFETLSAARRARLEALEAVTHARRVPLRPFTSDEVGHYLRWRAPDRDFTADEIARRYSETGGNPLLLEQFDRRFSPGPPRARPEAPGNGAAAPAQVPALSEAEERALAVAAVLGPEFPFGLLLRASGEDEERLAETIDRLVHEGVLFERPGELLAFADDRRREQVYDALTESRRRLLHRRAGEALEATGSADIATIYALARHFHLGKADERSLQYNRAAAEIADRAFSPEVAREHLERALESFRRLRPDDVDGEAELVLEIARQTDHLGLLKEADSYLERYLERRASLRLSPHLRALLELYRAQVLTDRGDWSAAEAATARVLAGTELSTHPLVRLGLHRLRGEALYYEGRYSEALAEHTEELQLARESGNERATALGLVRRAYVRAMLGQAEGAMAEARNAAQILERVGDARESAQAHLFLGVVIAGSSSPAPRYAEAADEFAEAIRLAEKAHDARRVGWALFNSADILREAGRLDEAAERTRRAREILERMGDRFGLVQTMIVQGKIELDRAEYDRAEADLLDAYRLVRELRAPADEVDVVLRLAQLSYARGDRATARRRVAELERQNLPALRPDVAGDFERLKTALRGKEGEDAPSS